MANQESSVPSIIIDTQPYLPDLHLISRGKVRDIYTTSNPDALLFVASDRISAHDVIMKNGIPGKGKIITRISLFWFNFLKEYVPNHLITADVDEMPEEVHKYKYILEGRSMLVRKAEVLPIEAIVRGYLTGSASAEYRISRTVHGIRLPDRLRESEKLPQALFTPSTKAAPGMHDHNIHPNEAADLLGPQVAGRVARLSVELYTRAAQYTISRGVILADTKFEFGLYRSSRRPLHPRPRQLRQSLLIHSTTIRSGTRN